MRSTLPLRPLAEAGLILSMRSGRSVYHRLASDEVADLLERLGGLTAVLEAVYHAHTYEEPIVLVSPTLRTLHIRGRDEDNPDRFWNRPAADWVPAEHR